VGLAAGGGCSGLGEEAGGKRCCGSWCCSASPVEEGRSVGGALQGWLKEVKRLLAAEAPVEDGERSAVRRDGAAVLSAENERSLVMEMRE